jgi:hypothetical protein
MEGCSNERRRQGVRLNRQHIFFRWGGRSFLAGLWLMTLSIVACQTQPNQVFIDVDGGRQALTTQAVTVRDALTEASIELGPSDRVKPDLYAELEPGLVVVVTRVKEEIETEREVIPFERQTVTNEALPAGETRLSQLGVNGEDEISIRVVYENGAEVSRTEVSRTTVIQPKPEILVVGPQGELPSTPIEGTIAYISNGNAWLMRDSSGSRRPLTTSGDLDGRVFSLSPDGRQLLYTRALTKEIDLPLNEMWLASTTIVGEAPITSGVQGVLFAEWSPVISQPLIAYSTAERTAGPPGWRANNDLWLFAPSGSPLSGEAKNKAKRLIPANTQGLYPWWGTTFAWSPDGTRLAYARADQIGVIDLKMSNPISYTTSPLIDFTPLKTFSDWVWVPGMSWSPDGQFLATTVHGPPVVAEPAEESQRFDMWLIGVKNGLSAKVREQAGMWANPAWGKAGIVFGEAVDPFQSANSRYYINIIDRDGSNKRQLFPFREEPGVQLPELVWFSQGEMLLFTYNGNLYIIDTNGGVPKQITSDGQASHPQWVSAVPPITSMSSTTTLSNTNAVTPTAILSSSQAISETAPLSATATTPFTIPVTSPVEPPAVVTQTQPISVPAIVPVAGPTIQPTSTVTITPSLQTDEN